MAYSKGWCFYQQASPIAASATEQQGRASPLCQGVKRSRRHAKTVNGNLANLT